MSNLTEKYVTSFDEIGSANGRLFSYIKGLSFQEQKYESKKRNLQMISDKFSQRREEIFSQVDELLNMKKTFDERFRAFFDEHQKKIKEIENEIEIVSIEYEKKVANENRLNEKSKSVQKSFQKMNEKIEKFEKEDQILNSKIKSFQKVLCKSEQLEFQSNMNNRRLKQMEKVNDGLANSIEIYENQILSLELQISEMKLKINNFFEQQTQISEEKNEKESRDSFRFLMMKNQICELNEREKKITYSQNECKEIQQNKSDMSLKMFEIENAERKTKEKILDLEEEISEKIRGIETLNQISQKPKNAQKKMTLRRKKQEFVYKDIYQKINEKKKKTSFTTSLQRKAIQDSKLIESKLIKKIEYLNRRVIKEDTYEKEIMLQTMLIENEFEKNRLIERESTEKSIEYLDQLRRKIELERKIRPRIQCQPNIPKKSRIKETLYLESSSSTMSPLNSTTGEVGNNINNAYTNKNNNKKRKDFIVLKDNISNSNTMDNLNKSSDFAVSEKSSFLINIPTKNRKETKNKKGNTKIFNVKESFNRNCLDNKSKSDISETRFKLQNMIKVTDLSKKIFEIEEKIQSKCARIEYLRQKNERMKIELENNQQLSKPPPVGAIERMERFGWFLNLIEKEKNEWMKSVSLLTINGLLFVWKGVIERL